MFYNFSSQVFNIQLKASLYNENIQCILISDKLFLIDVLITTGLCICTVITLECLFCYYFACDNA